MTVIANDRDKKRILAALAQAMVEHPRASMQELAKAVGMGKATLQRFCRTREQLIEMLTAYSMEVIDNNIRTAGLDTAHPLDALERLTASSLEQKEISSFIMLHVQPDTCYDIGEKAGWDVILETFFLRGQQEGVFRIDIPAPALTEIWIAIITGLIDAERRGKVARARLLDLVGRSFLQGCAVQNDR